MPCYNEGKYIKKAIESVLHQQTSFNYQLVITDDCSTDNSKEIILKYAKDNPEKITYIFSNTNTKLLSNIIRAIPYINTDYFCVLDADDYWTDYNYLERAYSFLDEHKDYSIYEENVKCLYETNNSEKFFIEKSKKNNTFSIDDYFSNKIIISQNTGMFFRNKLFINGIPEIMTNAVNTFSESSFRGDWDRFVMHLKFGKVYYCNKICGVYLIQDNGIWSSLNQPKRLLLAAQSYYDNNIYYDYKYNQIFIRFISETLIKILEELKNGLLKKEYFDNKNQFYVQYSKLYEYVKLNGNNFTYEIERNKIKRALKIFLKKLYKKIEKHIDYI